MSCLRMLLKHRELIWNLTLLDLKIRYAGSRFGLLWMLLVPLMITGSYVLLFDGILRVRPMPNASSWDYSLLMACGLLPWIGFSEGVNQGTSSVLAQRNLLKSHLFPVELLPVTSVCAALVGQLVGTITLVTILGFRHGLQLTLLFLPVLLIFQVLFTIGLVWVLSCVNILYRDLSHVVGFMLILLMIVSPIAYVEQMVPRNLELVVKLNPLSYLIEGYRDVILRGHLPDSLRLMMFGVWALVILQTGYWYFARLKRSLPDFL